MAENAQHGFSWQWRWRWRWCSDRLARTGSGSSARPPIMLPEYFALAAVTCQHPCAREQQIGPTVEQTDLFRPHRFQQCQPDHSALPQAAYRARPLALGGGHAPPGSADILERRKPGYARSHT